MFVLKVIFSLLLCFPAVYLVGMLVEPLRRITGVEFRKRKK